MATILMAWELGGGLGHLIPLRALGQVLVQRGHQVVIASRDLSRMDELFAATGIRCLRAPVQLRKAQNSLLQIGGFAHVLWNIGFGAGDLPEFVGRWEALFDDVQPDLVVADHSPTALLALRGRPTPRVNINLAFSCPPDTFPLPYWWYNNLPPWREQVMQEEDILLEKVNRVLKQKGKPVLARMGRLFAEIDDVVLGTYRELDPYGDRKNGRYWGHWHCDTGLAPIWPDGEGVKIFAYLKPLPILEKLMGILQKSGLPTLVFSGGLEAGLVDRFAGPTMRFERRPMEMSRVAAECDLAIFHAGHGTTATMLLAGKPCLLIPIQAEQGLTAQSVAKFDCGKWVMMDAESEQVQSVFQDVLTNEAYRQGAQAFAARYAGFVPGQQLSAIATRLESLLSRK